MTTECPIFKTAEEAWREVAKDVLGNPDEARAIFFAGMSAAMSILFHYGMADLRSEIEREFCRDLY